MVLPKQTKNMMEHSNKNFNTLAIGTMLADKDDLWILVTTSRRDDKSVLFNFTSLHFGALTSLLFFFNAPTSKYKPQATNNALEERIIAPLFLFIWQIHLTLFLR